MITDMLHCLFALVMQLIGPFMRPNYVVHTHRRGWIHITKASSRDRQEITGMSAPYPELQ